MNKKVMKISALQWLAFTTIVLITIVVFITMNLSFGYIFFLTVFGQVLLAYSVYKILKEDYTTDKTFDDFYEDRPDLGR